MKKIRSLAPATLSLAFVLVACGGSRQVTDADRALAHMEGVFQCDVSRFAFDDVAEIDVRLDEALAELSSDRDEYKDFKSFLGSSDELQGLVEEAYDGRC